MKHAPKLDPAFVPFGIWRATYLKEAKQPIPSLLPVPRAVFLYIKLGTPEMAEADYRYVERYVKFLLWSTGGFRAAPAANLIVVCTIEKNHL